MALTDQVSTQWISGGVDAVYVGFFNADGIFTGGHGTLARGDISFMRRWQGVKTVSTEVPERNRVTITGDDRPQGFLRFDRTDSPGAAFQVANRDHALESEIVGLNAASRNQYNMLLFDPKLDTTQNVCVISQAQAKASEYGVASQSGWEIIDLWKGEIDPGSPTGLEEQTGHAADFQMTFERESVYPDNVALTEAVEGTDQASGNIFADKYRFIRGAFKGDGTMTTINLPFTPAAVETDTDIYAVEITKRDTAGVTTILTPTTDFTTTLSPARITLTSAALYDHIYTVNEKYAR
jgi:hypothetical protein